jgi:L-threonylcarbamoyladenylate synthase
MQVVPVHPGDPRPARIQAACDVLRAGGVVALPTETFYGLAVDSSQPAAVSRLNELKVKAADSPVLLLAAGLSQIERISSAPPPVFAVLASAFWPGPLTLVLPAAPGLSIQITGGRGTVGVRIPGLALPRLLAEALGSPVTGVSANRHGEPPPRSAAEVAAAFPEGIDLLLDGGPTSGGAPSTILDLAAARPTILRVGMVREAALRPFLPDLQGAPASTRG